VNKRCGPPLPTLTLNRLHYKLFRLSLIVRNPQALSGLKACMGCGGIAFPVFAPTPGCDRVTHGTHLPPNPTLLHSIIMQVRQDLSKFGKVANFLPKWCKTVPEWPVACTLCPHLAFSHTSRLLTMFEHVTHGWG